MAIFDKVKNQAAGLAAKAQGAAQEAAREGKAKLDEVQARRKNDARLRALGAAVYLAHQGRGGEASEATMQRLIEEIAAYEAAGGSLDGPDADD